VQRQAWRPSAGPQASSPHAVVQLRPLTAIRSQRHTRASGGRDSQPCVRPTGYFRACHSAYLVMYVASSYEHSTSGIHAKSTSKNWAGSDSIDAPVSMIVCQRHCGQTQTGGRCLREGKGRDHSGHSCTTASLRCTLPHFGRGTLAGPSALQQAIAAAASSKPSLRSGAKPTADHSTPVPHSTETQSRSARVTNERVGMTNVNGPRVSAAGAVVRTCQCDETFANRSTPQTLRW
jgi:hypothetical protein